MDSYSTIKIGSKYSDSFKVFITHNEEIVSAFHDIPCKNGQYFNCVNEIPRFEHAKFEISKSENFNPIMQNIKKGKVRFVKNVFPMFGYPFNYGAIPQTWEDPKHKDDQIGAFGDNDPLDVIEIGTRRKTVGEVYKGKVLGAYALLDGGEADWKIVVIDSEDELAEKLNNVEDINRYLPGHLDYIFAWLRDYKLSEDKPKNEFAMNGDFLDAKLATEVVEKMHLKWKELILKGYEGIRLSNRTVKDSKEYSSSSFKANGKEEKETEKPDNLFTFPFSTK